MTPPEREWPCSDCGNMTPESECHPTADGEDIVCEDCLWEQLHGGYRNEARVRY